MSAVPDKTKAGEEDRAGEPDPAGQSAPAGGASPGSADQGGEPAPAEEAARARPRLRPRWLLAAGVGALVAVGIGIVLGRVVFSGLFPSARPHPPARAAPSAAPPPGFVEFRDRRAGFALAYPASWSRLRPADPRVALIAARGREASILARVTPLGFEVKPANVGSVKALTASVVAASGDVRLLGEPKRISLGRLPGYFYLYAFRDPRTGRPGTHSHYFVFDGDRMISLVLQAVPASRFPRLAPVFDQIAGTFRRTPP